jgi:hypothetical protein
MDCFIAADFLLASVSAGCGIMALNTAYRWRATRGCSAAQRALPDAQRRLLGLPPAAAAHIAAAGSTAAEAARALGLAPLAPARPLAPLGTPLSPPLVRALVGWLVLYNHKQSQALFSLL